MQIWGFAVRGLFGHHDPFASGGPRLTHFLARGSPTAAAFATAWAHLQTRTAAVHGPMDAAAALAGSVRGNSRHIQRAITAQVEQAARDDLELRIIRLPQRSQIRQAFMACDKDENLAANLLFDGM